MGAKEEYIKKIKKPFASTKLGIGLNTILGIPKATFELGRDIVQSVPRSILSTALTLAPKKVKKKIDEINPREDFGKVGPALLGKEPIKTIPKTGISALESFGVSKEKAKTFGPILGLGLTSLDLYPGTAGKSKAIKTGASKIIRELPKELAERQIMLEIRKEMVENNPLKQLLKHVQKKGDYKGQLPEVGTGGKSKFARQGDTMLENNYLNKDSETIRTEMDDYLSMRNELKAEEKLLKEDLKKWKTTPHLKFDADGNKIAYTKREQAIVDRSSRALEPQVPVETKVVTEPVGKLGQTRQVLQTQGGKVNIPRSIEQDSELVSSYSNSIQQKIRNAKEATGYFDEFDRVLPDPTEYPTQVYRMRDFAKNFGFKDKVPQFKDISTYEKGNLDLFRSAKKVFGKDYEGGVKQVFDELDTSKGNFIKYMDTKLDGFKSKIIDDLGIKRGSKESQYVQLFGEGKVKPEELINKFGADKATKIVEADQWFRKMYDDLLKDVNTTKMQIYPNNPEKWVLKRKDYYRHFQEMSSEWSRLKNIMDSSDKIDPMLVGISETTKPKSKWASFAQKRIGTKTKEDAVGGFLDYLPNASYAVHIDPNIGNLRGLAETLGYYSGKTKNLNNYIDQLDDFANILSGKTHTLDRGFSKYAGRKTLKALDMLNNRVKANTILGNLRASVSQIYNVPQGIASAGKRNSLKAVGKTLGQIFIKDTPINKSTFIKERYWKGLSKFDEGILNNTKKFAVWMISALDEVGTKFMWNGQYEKALKEGIKNPIKFADDATRSLVGGRGIGEKSALQYSKLYQMVAPFQLEVNNLMWVYRDLWKDNPGMLKKADKFATLLIANYLMNEVGEKVTGDRVTFDPINAMVDAIKEFESEEDKGTGVAKGLGRLGGEVLSNVPLGQTAASMYPESGINLFGLKTPTRQELFGRADPTRYGSGLLSIKALSDPLYKILPPLGGGQAKKMIEYGQAKKDGISRNRAGTAQFDVGGTVLKDLQGFAFGKYAGEDARQFFNEDITYAESIIKKIKDKKISKEELVTKLKNNPSLKDNIKFALKKESLGITDSDQKLINMGVANKQRAEAVAKKLNKLKTKEEKKQLLIEYAQKGILTKEVAKQLVEFLNK